MKLFAQFPVRTKFQEQKENPCNSSLVLWVLEESRRISAKPVTKKEHKTSDILLQIMKRYGTGSTCSSLPDIWISCMWLLLCSFFSDLVNLKRSDIVFYENHLSLLISISKTRKLKTGSNVIVSRIDNVTCPYKLLKLYSKIAIFSGQLLFVRNLVNIN